MNGKMFIGSGLAALLLLSACAIQEEQPQPEIEAPRPTCMTQGQRLPAVEGSQEKNESKSERGKTMRNVRDFGAVGDGVTKDTAAVQN